MKAFTHESIHTLGQLKKAGYHSRSVKQEMRENLMQRLKSKEALFTGIQGYEDTVIPQLQSAILSKHNIILLGLRGQAKTRIARQMTELLDEWMPVVDGSEIHDDPFAPISKYARDLVADMGDNTPIAWVHRHERFTEKLATPDVSVADLIGDVDPIKAATLKLPYNDERVIHYGLIPRSHRSIFVINELPDLQARIQVALFNILQEGDIQVRGFKLRMPLDIQFVFTANPEDYTNRGSIVTPLKDRIDSQILTHYPKTIEVSKSITLQEADTEEQESHVSVSPLLHELIELVAFEARDSEYIDKKSGVSARLTISALENLYSTAERRMLLNAESKTTARLTDVYGILPALTGKMELVYEGELEGVSNVAMALIGKAIRKKFAQLLPDPDKIKRAKKTNPYEPIIRWFNEGNLLQLHANMNQQQYQKELGQVTGLKELVNSHFPSAPKDEQHLLEEFVLHGLAEYSQVSRDTEEGKVIFNDLVSSMFSGMEDEEE